jgi:hypothetical protein
VDKLGVDETSFQAARPGRATRYVTGLVDLDGRRMIDLVPGNSAGDLRRWCAQADPDWLAQITALRTMLTPMLSNTTDEHQTYTDESDERWIERDVRADRDRGTTFAIWMLGPRVVLGLPSLLAVLVTFVRALQPSTNGYSHGMVVSRTLGRARAACGRLGDWSEPSLRRVESCLYRPSPSAYA